ncbi:MULTISPECIES: hypothetical protein [unclassified Ruegeria]|uniref:hypothetical protein n=1 Tax=unclassified Ruegeria TaxID=2625375 RepID=UPI001490F4D2|nr:MULTISPECIES: hypothetical protein [unclassified Ruegeria]NOD90581.1 hypothetical protein [Ruegeria sp. HKCCD4318]NOE15916.1 hypothetical protein [Ruegeria sp. HKCCD4318-2]NOG10808.1 hypothetical protein [Ruegeria sp. HKCCD4315]
MNDLIGELNAWIVTNTAAVVTVGIPLFTVFVGFLGSYIQFLSKKNEIRINGRIKLADARIEQFEQLKCSIEQLLIELSLIARKHYSNSESIEVDDLYSITQLANSVTLQVRTNKFLRDEFVNEYKLFFSEISASIDEGREELGSANRFRETCLNLLDQEWLSLETELKENK